MRTSLNRDMFHQRKEKTMKKELFTKLAFSLLSVGLIAGCAQEQSAPQVNAAADNSYLVTVEPTGAQPVGEAREASNDEQEVTLEGRIGGSSKPFIDGLAAFTIVDPKVPYCSEEEGCPTPWDYCCEDKTAVTAGSATVRIVGDDGEPLSASAQGAGGLAPARFLIVDGTVTDKNPDGVFVVDARRIWVGGRPDREDSMKGSRSGEEKVNVDPHDHDFDGIPDHDHDHHDHDH